MRIAVIDKKKCEHEKCNYECENYCPGVRMGEETIVKGDDGFPIISEELCTGCGICTKKCPFGAIEIVNLPEMLDNPIHQYGVNGFRVFHLPVPKQTSVVGIIGANGIGKSTCLKILGGQLKPNLGKDGAEWEEVIELYRGQEIQNHLEKVRDGKVRIAFKPQNVDQIPQAFKGTVKELLENTKEKEYDLSALEIEHVMNKKLNQISGGELQRIAIAVTLQKDADLYCFDEPTSYLDVKQRMRVAKIIRELSEEKEVLLIEHDLAVLDYLSDYIHVLYGKNSVYGIVSKLKSVRVGINEFLDGFLNTENMRFRSNGIKFPVKAPADEWKGKESFEYPDFEVKYEGFALNAKGGVIRNGEVIGIMGANGIGKSTFMRVLAGEEQKMDWTAKISYKPQYITTEFEGTVIEYLLDQKLNQEIFDTYLRKEIQDLQNKKMKDLSGGELQRVAISSALAKECDICLLDEPSAFLDVEQRIRFADIIRKITEKTEITTMVIDHDITLQDYVSDRLMIFTGEPGKKGFAEAPEPMHSGMNKFLKEMNITYRRDPETGRPRVNKENSQKDSEQKKSGEYYYA